MKSAVTLKNVRHKTELNSRPEVSVHRSSFMDHLLTERVRFVVGRRFLAELPQACRVSFQKNNLKATFTPRVANAHMDWIRRCPETLQSKSDSVLNFHNSALIFYCPALAIYLLIHFNRKQMQ